MVANYVNITSSWWANFASLIVTTSFVQSFFSLTSLKNTDAQLGKDLCNLEKDPPCLRRWLSTRINGSQIIIKDHFPRITPPTESCVNTTIIITVGHCLLSTGEHMTPSSASAGCFAEGTTLEGGKRRVCLSVCLTGGGVCRERGRERRREARAKNYRSTGREE